MSPVACANLAFAFLRSVLDRLTSTQASGHRTTFPSVVGHLDQIFSKLVAKVGQAGPSVFHQIHFLIACYCACQCHWNVLCLFLHSYSFCIIYTALECNTRKIQRCTDRLTSLPLPMQNQSHLPLKFRRNSAAAQVCSTHVESTVDVL